MERLNNAIAKLEDFYNRLQLGEDALMPYDNNELIIGWLKELKAYRDAEEQGLRLRLPCKVGDTVYHFMNIDDVMTVCEHRFATLINIVEMIENGSFGKDVFLTKEEAEQKLVEMKGTEKDCSNCENYTEPDEVDNGCYMCCKGYENNYSPKKKTNGDCIRSMTDEELVDILPCPYDAAGDYIMPCMLDEDVQGEPTEEWCQNCMLEWLRKEVE